MYYLFNQNTIIIDIIYIGCLTIIYINISYNEFQINLEAYYNALYFITIFFYLLSCPFFISNLLNPLIKINNK